MSDTKKKSDIFKFSVDIWFIFYVIGQQSIDNNFSRQSNAQFPLCYSSSIDMPDESDIQMD